MKKIGDSQGKIFFLFLFLIIAFPAGVQADYFDQTAVDPVRFFVVDDTSDKDVTLSVWNCNVEGTLKWSTDNSTWKDAGTAIEFSISEENGRQLVYWKLYRNGEADITKANLHFEGSDHDDLWNSVTIQWDTETSTQFTLGTPNGDDNVAPVPITGAALFLGSGLVAMVCIRRRII